MAIGEYITTKEAAKKLKVSVGRIQQFVAEKRLPAIKVGQTNLVKESDLLLIEDLRRTRWKRQRLERK